MFFYFVLGCVFIIVFCGFVYYKEEYLVIVDNLVYFGVVFLLIGMFFGFLWVKEVWGNYWSWDFKEIWVVVIWMGYLLYIYLCL